MNLSEKLSLLMKKNNIKNVNQLSKLTDIPYSTIMDILDGNVDIRISTSLKLVRFFNITLDTLLDDDIELNDTNSSHTLYVYNEELDEEDSKKVDSFVLFLRQQEKYRDKK